MLENQQAISIPRQIPFWRQIRWQLMLAFVLMSIIPVIIIVTIIFIRETDQTQEQIFNQLHSIADLKESQINIWVEVQKSALDIFLADPMRLERFIGFTQDSLNRDTSIDNADINELLTLTVDASPEFEELFVYNSEGDIIAASNPVQISKVVISQPYFWPSLTNEKYVQSPYTEINTGELAMFITSPLLQNDEVVGVLAGRLNLETLARIMLDRSGLGTSGETYLVSQESNKFLTPSRFEGYVQTRAYYSEGIDAVLLGQDNFGLYLDYRDPPVPVFGVYRWIPEIQAGLLAEIDQSEATLSINESQLVSALLSGLTVLVAIVLGFIIATRISNPITSLTGVATRVAAGDLNQHVDIVQQNEIGLLAEVFNSMTAQLRNLILSLENRVVERTERLAILAQMNERFSAILDLEKLLQEVVTETQKQFGYYYVHIYLLDKAEESLVVAEGTGSAGAEMKQNRHSISLDAPTSLVARAARTRQIVRVDNVRDDEGWLPNTLLPDTYAEMAVPIILDTQVVGILDVQEDSIAGLDDGDANILRALANQVAIAIRNANVFQDVETALTQARQAQERYTLQTWEKGIGTHEATDYLYMQPTAAPLPIEILIAAETEAYTKTEPTMLDLQVNNVDRNAGAIQTLVAPIKLDNQVIGALQIHQFTQEQDPDHLVSWTEDDLTFIETILDQLAQTAENLRLFGETQERAARERLIGQIGDRLRGAPNMEALMEIGVSELSKILNPARTFVHFGSQADLTEVDGPVEIESK